ncbi:MAG: DUF2461 domain-containing protein [Microbacteriaceae bacterium]|nr:DUF2461 domain-containing protein [Nocardioidaceae bacterium]MCL2794236.1 DUF2461 domain-containing protein [Microbacteriaceae bacterium]
MEFSGWPSSAVDFYRGLEVDNSKAYFQANKAVYDEAVVGPAKALLAEFEPRFGPGKVFRPNRDIRFSPDKSPYKTTLGVVIGDGGFVHFDAHELMVGGGLYGMGPTQLAAYRAAVDAPATGLELEAIVADARAAGFEPHAAEALATVPRGFDKAHPRAELLRLKGIALMRHWSIDTPWISTPEAFDHIAAALDDVAPLRDWLARNIPTEARPSR